MTISLKRASLKIAYTAAFVAICFLVNYIYIPFGSFFAVSLVPAVCFIAGAFLGPYLGFAVGLISDILGCFAHGYPPNIFILLGSAMWGFIVGMAFKKLKFPVYLKIFIGALVAYFVCSFLLNSYGMYTYTSKGISFWAYAVARIPVQLPNLIVNAIISALIIKALTPKEENTKQE